MQRDKSFREVSNEIITSIFSFKILAKQAVSGLLLSERIIHPMTNIS
jgi:hypothetical protein